MSMVLYERVDATKVNDFSFSRLQSATGRLYDQMFSPAGIAVIGGLTAIGLSLKVPQLATQSYLIGDMC
jgi:hypothetical protein